MFNFVPAKGKDLKSIKYIFNYTTKLYNSFMKTRGLVIQIYLAPIILIDAKNLS